jgi:Family of unknown function (DUF6171)
MTWQDALEIVVESSKHERFRVLCDEDHPRNKEYRLLVLNLAGGIPDTPASLQYPSLFQQVTNAAKAVGSVVASAVRGEAVSVPQEEQDRRLAICHACEFWDTRQGRCSKCGCFGAWKTWLASQRCPIDKW